MIFVLLFVLVLPGGETGSLRGGRADQAEWLPPAPQDPGLGPGATTTSCGQCDVRTCPLVSAETCRGAVVKDRCGCCPFCDTMKPAKLLASTETNTSTNAACEKIKCPRNKICLLNIQNIPMCRCPSAYYCRRQHLSYTFRLRGETPNLCGRDGKTYKNRCLLQVAECATGRKIRVAHRGKCMADTLTAKNRGNRKHASRITGSNNSHREERPITQVISQYPPAQAEFPNHRDRNHAQQGRKRQGDMKRQKNKNKEGRKQRRKERKNRRTKRRYRIYWL